jgi:hypothetical protein
LLKWGLPILLSFFHHEFFSEFFCLHTCLWANVALRDNRLSARVARWFLFIPKITILVCSESREMETVGAYLCIL